MNGQIVKKLSKKTVSFKGVMVTGCRMAVCVVPLLVQVCSGLTTQDIEGGKFLPALGIDSTYPLSSQALQVVFNTSLENEGAENPGNYRIQSAGGGLDVLAVSVLPDSNSRIVTLTTAEQVSDQRYTLFVDGLAGKSGLKPPAGGTYSEFIGYSANANSPNLVVSRLEVPYASGGVFRLPDSDIGSGQVEIVFTLENNGMRDLLLFGDLVLNDNTEDLFSISQPADSIISAGASAGFSVFFSPDKLGSNSAGLVIESTDPDESSYQLTLVAVVTDNLPPDTGGSNLVLSGVQKYSIDVSWPAASDNAAAPEDLRYRLYYTDISAMDSVGSVEGLGTPVFDYTAGQTSSTVSGLEPDTVYYFNVLVKDPDGNLSSYTSQSATTLGEAQLAAEIRSGVNGSNPSELYVWNNRLYFRADDGTNGNELYEMSTGAAPVLHDIHGAGSSAPEYFTGYNSKLYFSADDGSAGRELWEYDGVNAPQITYDLNSGPGSTSPRHLTVFNGKLVFGQNNNPLYEYSGSGAPLAVTGSSYAFLSGSTMGVAAGHLFFYGNFSGTPYGLSDYPGYYDGTNAPDFIGSMPGSDPPYEVQFVAEYNNKAYFASDITASGFYSLIEYDVQVATAPVVRYGDNVTDIEPFNGKLYFAGNSGGYPTYNIELWVYDGSSTSMVAEINQAGSSHPQYLTVSNGKLYFSADDGSNGRELWVYDGINPPHMVLDINVGSDSNPSHLVDWNGVLYFQANDGINGTEVWKLNP